MSEQLNQRVNSADGNPEISEPYSEIFKRQQDQNAKLREQHRAEMKTKKQEIDDLESAVKEMDHKLFDQKMEFAFEKIQLKQQMEAARVKQEKENQLLKIKLELSARRTDDLESRIERSDLEVSQLKKTVEDKEDTVEAQKKVFDEHVHSINLELTTSQERVKNLTAEIKLQQEEKVAQETKFKVEKDDLMDKHRMELNNKDILFALTANTQLAERENLRKRVSEMERTMEKWAEKMMTVQLENDALQCELEVAKSSEELARDEAETWRQEVVALMAKSARFTGQKEGESSVPRAPSPPSHNNSADDAHGEPTLSGQQEEVSSKKKRME